MENKTQVIVVGGGPAGISAAVTVARTGKEVILIERGNFCGSKNVFGGAVYTKPIKEIFPNFEENAPLERNNTKHKYMLLTENEDTTISHSSVDENSNSYTVIRAKFDRWLSEQAKKEGVTIVTQTLVKDLIIKNNRIIGIKTELEDYYADIVILADGVNSLLAKKAGLRNDFKPSDVALGVKEVFKIDSEKINERFNLKENEGCITEIIGYPMNGMLGLGYIYTNKNSVTIGLGVALDELTEKQLKPYELLDKLKLHPSVAPLIKDGELLEYSAHLIPEGGYNKIPQLYGNGVMVVGDAAMLVNNLHWEGTNLAMISGKFAGETAVEAIKMNDFSKNTLKLYKQKLDKSFIIKDLKSYRNLMPTMHKRRNSFTDYYIKKISSFFEMFTSVDGIVKRDKFRNFIKSIFTDRNISELFKDGFAGIKLLWEILK
ncbi:FAD-dependent oxidoreductase [bacterium]|nr:FAD-dependent oxidoreductase [bacterium]